MAFLDLEPQNKTNKIEIGFIKYMNIVEVLKTDPTGSQNKLDVTYTIIHGL